MVAGTGRTHRTHGTGRTQEFLPLPKIDSDLFLLFQLDSVQMNFGQNKFSNENKCNPPLTLKESLEL